RRRREANRLPGLVEDAAPCQLLGRVLRPPDLVAAELEALLLAGVARAAHRLHAPLDRRARLVSEVDAQHVGLVRPAVVREPLDRPGRQEVAVADLAVDLEQREARDRLRG